MYLEFYYFKVSSLVLISDYLSPFPLWGCLRNPIICSSDVRCSNSSQSGIVLKKNNPKKTNLVEVPIHKAHVFSCRLSYASHGEIMKSFQQLYVAFGKKKKKKKILAANQGVSLKFLNVCIIHGGSLLTGLLELI